MSSLLHTIALVTTIVFAYIWLSVDALQPYTLQVFALTVAVFFIAKRLGKAKLWHIAPEHSSLEITLLTFAFLILVGATGNLNSPFFALLYVHLFFLVLSCRPSTAIITTVVTVLFHLALAGTVTLAAAQTLISLPILLLIFLFAKNQYDEAQAAQAIIADEAQQLEKIATKEQSLENFLTNFLQPRLETLTTLSTDTTTTKELGTQLSLINSEVEKLLQE